MKMTRELKPFCGVNGINSSPDIFTLKIGISL